MAQKCDVMRVIGVLNIHNARVLADERSLANAWLDSGSQSAKTVSNTMYTLYRGTETISTPFVQICWFL